MRTFYVPFTIVGTIDGFRQRRRVATQEADAALTAKYERQAEPELAEPVVVKFRVLSSIREMFPTHARVQTIREAFAA